jgi:hypothetical protein
MGQMIDLDSKMTIMSDVSSLYKLEKSENYVSKNYLDSTRRFYISFSGIHNEKHSF